MVINPIIALAASRADFGSDALDVQERLMMGASEVKHFGTNFQARKNKELYVS